MSVKATYLGHAAVLLEGGDRAVVIDPFLKGNPSATRTPESIRADIVCLTHDHEDHFGDTESFLKRGATFVGIHELATRFAETGYKAEGMNIGGSVEVAGVRIHMTHALHTCYTGHPVGFVVEIAGKQVYHAGDTGLTMDMKLLAEFFSIDLAFLPIGDRYTMGAASAAKAVEFTGARRAVPMHYGTWPLIEGKVREFQSKLGEKAVILAAGESVAI